MLSRAVSAPCPRYSTRRIVRFMEGVSLWLAFLLMLASHSLVAEAMESPASAGSFRFVGADGAWQEPATLLTTDYQVTVSGLLANTRLRQSFSNTSQQWREGVFVFPLPEQASVHGLIMTAGERRIVGEIRERQQARKAYDQAKREGRQVARVEQQRPNLFTTRLANIPPGETVTVELQYQQRVRYQSGEFELRLPITLTPRYMPGAAIEREEAREQHGWASATTQVPAAHEISPFTVNPEDVGAGSHQATVSLEIDAGLPIVNVSSPSHAVSGTWDRERVTVVPHQSSIPMDRDLLVRWQPARGEEPSAAVFHERWQGEDYLMALLVPGLSEGRSMPRELVFVIDTSGSMAGASIRHARASLLKGLDTLRPDDRFNLIQFNSQTASLFTRAVMANGNNLARARRYVMGLEAGGGTEMAPALDRALQGHDAASADYLRQVVFITDGAVGNEAALFQRIREQLGNSRLFTVGIGSAPNMHFMREAARFGRGTYTAIHNGTDLSGPLDDLFAKMRSPVLADITTDWPDGDATALPGRVGDLFLGEPLVQVVQGQAAEGELVVQGRLPDGSHWQESLNLGEAVRGTGLHRHWAREQIHQLQDRSLSVGVDETTRQAITTLGLSHGLVTPYTSFLAVDRTPLRPAGVMLKSDSIPVLKPAGAGQGMLRYPQTATLSPLLVALGLVGLMFSLAAFLLRRVS